jgi:DNA invertase Pin-like site-specific DNA recombinase
MKAIIYCRKSTDRSDRQQLSVENQVDEAKKIAQRE